MFLFRVQNPLDLEMLPACMLMNMEREANYGDFSFHVTMIKRTL